MPGEKPIRPKPHLSKSRYLAGLQCERRLWLGWYDPERMADPPPGTILAVGHEVGEYAHRLFPGGVLVGGGPREFYEAVARTSTLLADSETSAIFEAAFEFDDVWVRVDVLERAQTGGWVLNEVKSSTRVKPENIDDLAIQRYVVEGCGLEVVATNLIHVDTSYVRGVDGIDWRGFFRICDVTGEVLGALAAAPGRVAQMHRVLALIAAPERRPSSHCFAPFSCEFWDRCTANKPVDWIWHLPHLRAKQLTALEAMGIESIRSVPADFPLSGAQRRVVEAFRTGDFVIQPALSAALVRQAGRSAFLDFETFSPAVPLYAGTSPYQRIAAQWSMHFGQEDGTVEHKEFIADLAKDPRRAFAESLLEAAEGDGPIFVYSSFERSVLDELAKHLPELAEGLRDLGKRLSDLLPIVRDCVDHPAFKGSNSIKAVAPVLDPELSYDDLPGIAHGDAASAALYRLATGRFQIDETPDALKAALLQYCALDTLALVRTRRALTVLAERGPPMSAPMIR